MNSNICHIISSAITGIGSSEACDDSQTAWNPPGCTKKIPCGSWHKPSTNLKMFGQKSDHQQIVILNDIQVDFFPLWRGFAVLCAQRLRWIWFSSFLGLDSESCCILLSTCDMGIIKKVWRGFGRGEGSKHYGWDYKSDFSRLETCCVLFRCRFCWRIMNDLIVSL